MHAMSVVPFLELNCMACAMLKRSLPYLQCLRQVTASAALSPAMAPVPARSAGTESFLNTRIISGSTPQDQRPFTAWQCRGIFTRTPALVRDAVCR